MPDDIETMPMPSLFELDGIDLQLFESPVRTNAKRLQPLGSPSNFFPDPKAKKQRKLHQLMDRGIELEMENAELRQVKKVKERLNHQYEKEVERLSDRIELLMSTIRILEKEKIEMNREMDKLHLLICLIQTTDQSPPLIDDYSDDSDTDIEIIDNERLLKTDAASSSLLS